MVPPSAFSRYAIGPLSRLPRAALQGEPSARDDPYDPVHTPPLAIVKVNENGHGGTGGACSHFALEGPCFGQGPRHVAIRLDCPSTPPNGQSNGGYGMHTHASQGVSFSTYKANIECTPCCPHPQPPTKALVVPPWLPKEHPQPSS